MVPKSAARHLRAARGEGSFASALEPVLVFQHCARACESRRQGDGRRAAHVRWTHRLRHEHCGYSARRTREAKDVYDQYICVRRIVLPQPRRQDVGAWLAHIGSSRASDSRGVRIVVKINGLELYDEISVVIRLDPVQDPWRIVRARVEARGAHLVCRLTDGVAQRRTRMFKWTDEGRTWCRGWCGPAVDALKTVNTLTKSTP